MKKMLASLILLGFTVAGGCSYLAASWGGEKEAKFNTKPITREDLITTITATGTVEPEDVVDVGAQVAGKLVSLGVEETDPTKSIDFGSVVKQDAVLARIDDSMYKAQVAQAAASLARAKADVRQMQAKLQQAKSEWKRAQDLQPQNAIAATDYDLARANYFIAEANVGVGEAVVAQSQAALDLANTNLDYTTIKSPVNGTIIARRVNVGQTVVASLNAPSLFLIAKDLSRMEVWVSVNEADIGRIRIGMPVQFNVDAYPDDVFRGQVELIRLNATMTQNVVLYTVVVNTDNSDRKLLPYLTANLKFEIETRKNVLQVPNSALRWRPRAAELVVPEQREQYAALLAAKDAAKKGGSGGGGGQGGAKGGDGAKSGRTKGGEGKPGNGKSGGEAREAGKTKASEERGRIWIKDGQFVRSIEVKIGATDGFFTEISGEGVEEKQEVVLSEIRSTAANDTVNPFMPKLPGRPPR